MATPTLTPSAHQDTFCRDNLPPADTWPRLEFPLEELRYPQRLNCATALLDEVVARPGPRRTALRSPTERHSYGELLEWANRIAAVLETDLGTVPGNRVLLRGPNTPWLVACWFGVLKAGGVVVTTMPLLRRGELRKLVDKTGSTIALCDHRFLDELAGIDEPTLRIVPYGGDSGDDLCGLLRDKPSTHRDVSTAADDVALLAPTSGTTGTPKVTMHFHRDVLAIADTFSAHVVRPDAEDVFTGTPPLAFTFGLGGLLVFPMRAGASTLLLETAAPAELAEAVARHGVTMLFTAPTAYRAMLAEGKHLQLAGLRGCVSAGEHLPEPVWREFLERTGVRIIDGIGGTEMLHVFIATSGAGIRPGSTGTAVPGYRAQVLDTDGNPVPDGRPGRLAVVGPTGCRYLADDRQGQYVEDGWNLTGDTYVRDADGYFWYRARSDDMIVSAGYNIAGPEVEQVLAEHRAVLECAVVGLPDERRGMRVHAAVVLVPGTEPGEQLVRTLQEHVKARLAPYKYPRSVECLDALPRTETGKLQRYRIREAYLARHATPVPE